MAKIYVASSWRNLAQPGIVTMLRKCGHDVYDFKNPANGEEFANREPRDRHGFPVVRD